MNFGLHYGVDVLSMAKAANYLFLGISPALPLSVFESSHQNGSKPTTVFSVPLHLW
jgi:hypothetical protein